MTHLPPSPPTLLRDKLAQLMVVRIGSNLPPVRTVEEDEARIAELLKRYAIGGLLLFHGRWPQIRDSLGRLQTASKLPLMISADIERGTGQQIDGKTLFPHAMALDQSGIDAEKAIDEFVRVTAAEARECGIHVAYAPVADVNTNPQNPIIATRAFSDDPQRASQLVARYIRAAKSAGLLTTAKHFPGHGDTQQDSHEALPRVDRDVHMLRACELLPFRAAIEEGVDQIMTAHVAYSHLDATGCPATLSRPILCELLRSEMGFTGAICSDSLLMVGVKNRFKSEAELVRSALAAGVDVLLDIEDPAAAIEALARDVETGKLADSRVDEAVERVWELKRSIDSFLPSIETSSSSATAAIELARRVLDNQMRAQRLILPQLASAEDFLVLYVRPSRSPTEIKPPPLAALTERLPRGRFREVLPELTPAESQSLWQTASEVQHVVIAVVVKPAAWHPIGLSRTQEELVEKLTCSRSSVLVSLGVPQVLNDYPAATVRLCTYSDVPAAQQALCELLAETG